MKTTFKYILSCLLLIIVASCKNDELPDLDKPNLISQIEISGLPTDVKYLYINTLLEANPTVSYEGKEDSEFAYKWTMGLGATSKVISEEKALNYILDVAGNQIIALEVTHLPTGLKQQSLMYVSVTVPTQESTTVNGWYLLKESASNKTDIDFFTYINYQPVFTENVLSASYRRPLDGKPIGASFNGELFWYNPATSQTESDQAVFMIASTSELVAFRAKDQKILGDNSTLFYDAIPTNSNAIQSVFSTPDQHRVIYQGKALGMQERTSGFMSAGSDTYRLSPLMTYPPYTNWYDAPIALAYDESKSSFAFFRKGSRNISYFPEAFVEGAPSVSSNNLHADLLFLENTAGTLDPTLSSSRAYAIMQEKANNNRLKLYGLNLAELNDGEHKAAHSPIVFERNLSKSAYPELTGATFRTMNKTSPIIYFVANGKVGYYNILDEEYKADWLSLEAGEEVTYFKYLDIFHNSSSLTLQHLVIATYKDGQYKVSRYDINGGKIQATGSPIQGSGRVKSLVVSSSDVFSSRRANARYY